MPEVRMPPRKRLVDVVVGCLLSIVAIPVVVFFLLVQRKIAFGLTAGAVKG